MVIVQTFGTTLVLVIAFCAYVLFATHLLRGALSEGTTWTERVVLVGALLSVSIGVGGAFLLRLAQS
jgi:hypothetical protein